MGPNRLHTPLPSGVVPAAHGPSTSGLPAPALPTVPERPPSPTRVGIVLAIAGTGLLLDALAYAMGRTGSGGPVVPLFVLGLLMVFVPCAWRLLSVDATRNERVTVSLVLGLGLLVAYVLRSPLIFDGFDELLHGANLHQMLAHRTVLPTNSLLPVSPYYPGLELVTVAVKWITGLPLPVAQTVVLLAVRTVLVLAVFFVVERVCSSPRAGGIGVLVYASNPQFYRFDAQYSYETLAMAFAASIVYLLIDSTDRMGARGLTGARPGADSALFVSDAPPAAGRGPWSAGLDFGLVLACIAAIVVTHHLTAWLTIGFLVVGAIGLRLTRSSPPRPRMVSLAALVGLAVGALWTAHVGNKLVTYLGPIFRDALTGAESALGRLHTDRQLFHTVAGGPRSPTWEIAVMLLAAAIWCVLLLPALYTAIRHKTVAGGRLRWVPVLIAATFPLTLLASFSSASSEVGVRATTFVFFAMAVVVAGWLVRALGADRGRGIRGAVVGVASVCFIGSLLIGSGPDWSLVTGRFLVSADQRSVTAPSLALAQWAAANLPAGARIAADRVNGALLADLAGVAPDTAIDGEVNVTPLLVDPALNGFERSLIKKGGIEYVVIDRRLAWGLPLFGTYAEPNGKPVHRISYKALDKFDGVPGVGRIYDNGTIQVYDVRSLLGAGAVHSRAAPIDANGTGTGTNFIVLGFAIAVAVFAFGRLRSRRSRPMGRHALRWILVFFVVGMAAAGILVPTQLSPTMIGLCGLALIGYVVLRCTRRTDSGADPDPGGSDDGHDPGARVGWSSAQRVCAVVGLVCASAAVAVSTVSARSEWRSPAALSLRVETAGVAGELQVTLPEGSGMSRLVVLGRDPLYGNLPCGPPDRPVPLPPGTSKSIALGQSQAVVMSSAAAYAVWS